MYLCLCVDDYVCFYVGHHVWFEGVFLEIEKQRQSFQLRQKPTEGVITPPRWLCVFSMFFVVSTLRMVQGEEFAPPPALTPPHTWLMTAQSGRGAERKVLGSDSWFWSNWCSCSPPVMSIWTLPHKTKPELWLTCRAFFFPTCDHLISVSVPRQWTLMIFFFFFLIYSPFLFRTELPVCVWTPPLLSVWSDHQHVAPSVQTCCTVSWTEHCCWGFRSLHQWCSYLLHGSKLPINSHHVLSTVRTDVWMSTYDIINTGPSSLKWEDV